jgi:hypothetical protein
MNELGPGTFVEKAKVLNRCFLVHVFSFLREKFRQKAL